MRPNTHSITLALLGFTTGALLVFALDRLPSIGEGPVAPPQSSSPAPAQTSPSAIRPAGFADAVAAAAPAVVKVYGSSKTATTESQQAHSQLASTSVPIRPPRAVAGPLAQTRVGSGVVLSSGGLVATNGHVVRGASQIRVELPDGRQATAALLGIDEATDLAALRLPLQDLPTIQIGDPQRLRIGDVVLAIGNPFGIGQTVSLGIVSATGRSRLGLTEIEDFIQTDAAINPGSSGGALVDTQGRLVGIATAGVSESGHSEGVGLAIPSNLVVPVIHTLSGLKPGGRGWIGLGGRSVTRALEQQFGLRSSQGVLVSTVAENSPAAAAGIRPGDVITTFGGEAIDDALQLQAAITGAPPGSVSELVLWRGSERMEAELTVGAWIPNHEKLLAEDKRNTQAPETARPQSGSDPAPSAGCSQTATGRRKC